MPPMRLTGLLLFSLALLAAPGCRRAAPDPLDPNQPGQHPVCPDAHVVMGLQAIHYEATQALLRFTADRSPCAGVLLPASDFGTLRTVGVLSDGSDLVGFAGSYGGGALVRVDGATVLDRVDDEAFYPISIVAVRIDGTPAAAVVWGSGSSSSDSGERLDVYAEADLSLLGRWEVSSETTRVARAPGDSAGRLALTVREGMQVVRAERGATTPPMAGELQVARPNGAGSVRSLHVDGEHVRMAAAKGVLAWQLGTAPAFLGPVQCRWPDTLDTPLPAENADHLAALVDPNAPEDTWVLVDGDVEGTDARSHLYLLRPRGECALIGSISPDHRAVALGR